MFPCSLSEARFSCHTPDVNYHNTNEKRKGGGKRGYIAADTLLLMMFDQIKSTLFAHNKSTIISFSGLQWQEILASS